MSEKSPESKFPFGKRAREVEIAHYREVAEEQTERERTRDIEQVYVIHDSPLDDFSSDDNFQLTSGRLFESEQETLRSYIEGFLGKKSGKAVGIEFGGTGSKLFAGFSKGLFARSVGVTLADIRHRLPSDPTAEDQKRHHDVLEGDIANLRTYQVVREWLGSEGADLIIERLAGGHMFMPREPHLLGQIFQQWYDLLAEDGIIIAQTSWWMRPLLVPWCELIEQQHKDTLDILYKHAWGNEVDVFDAIRLRKLHGAPAKLPLLDPKTMREISKSESWKGV